MIILASTWLLLALIMSAFAWVSGKRFAAFSLPLAVVLAALAVYVPTGSPRFTAPPAGKYTVVGADIEVDVAIYALLKGEDGVSRFYRLPYSVGQANALQAAKDGAGEDGQVTATIDGEGEGGTRFDGPPPVAGDPPKVPEQPAISLQ
jgi:hypothetical protein